MRRNDIILRTYFFIFLFFKPFAAANNPRFAVQRRRQRFTSPTITTRSALARDDSIKCLVKISYARTIRMVITIITVNYYIWI